MNNWFILTLAVVGGFSLLGWWFLGRACDAANSTDWGVRWVNRVVGLIRIYCRYYHRFQCEEALLLPEKGPALLVCNHLSGLDPILLIAAARRPLRFMIAREQYEHLGLNKLLRAAGCIPVDRASRSEVSLRTAFHALKAGEVVALFPQGKITPPSEFPRRLKPGVLWLAKKAHVPVYPVYLQGISGVGFVARSFFLRSRPKLTSFPPLDCQEHPDCLRDLQRLLEGTRN
ncbi:MAG: 1-acyl-sn-glycerol-3-phosphate acyltransferase [Gammaproteobacteria bacterium]|nr:1-acyl-sn-glycerol-3-phosphate acyltransferase [Gammaproteobacteria bacterium]